MIITYRGSQFRDLVYRGFSFEESTPASVTTHVITAREVDYPFRYFSKNKFRTGRIVITPLPKKGTVKVLLWGPGVYTLHFGAAVFAYQSSVAVAPSVIAKELSLRVNQANLKATTSVSGGTIEFNTKDAMDNYGSCTLTYTPDDEETGVFVHTYEAIVPEDAKGLEAITTDKIEILNRTYESDRVISRNYGFDRKAGEETFCFPADPEATDIFFRTLDENNKPVSYFLIQLTEEPALGKLSNKGETLEYYTADKTEYDEVFPSSAVVEANPQLQDKLKMFINIKPYFSGPKGTGDLWKYGFATVLEYLQDFPILLGDAAIPDYLALDDLERLAKVHLPVAWRSKEWCVLEENLPEATKHSIMAAYGLQDDDHDKIPYLLYLTIDILRSSYV